MPARARRAIGNKTETDVLARSRHRCALCFGLHHDTTVKQGQIAHIDQDASNDKYDNLVFLCLAHHDQYDSTTRQSKNFSAGEVRTYRKELDIYVSALKGATWPDAGESTEEPSVLVGPQRTSSPEVYERRIVIYRAFRSFLLAALREANVSLQELGKFAESTDEALFLLGPEVSDYLRQVYSKGVQLHYTANRIRDERLAPREDYSQVVYENAEVLNWLSLQLESGRVVFAKFLLLG